MSKLAWVTPDQPASVPLDCFQVVIPNTDEFRAAFRGAMLLLENVNNWEQVGTMTPEDAADYWLQANVITFGMTPCAAGGNEVPAGTVIDGLWTTAPSGYLMCDGASYLVADYADLFAIIGYDFGGSGDNFNVPDLRDKFIAGAGSGYAIGDTGGQNAVVLTISEMPYHNHTNQPMNMRGRGSGSLLTWTWQSGDVGVTGYAGGDQPHENRPPYMALNRAIKT